MQRFIFYQFCHNVLSDINTSSLESHISLWSRAQNLLKISRHDPEDVRKLSTTLDQHYPSLCRDRNTLKAQLQLRVKLCVGDKLTEWIID